MTILEAQEESEAWADVERERRYKDAEIARLRSALKPFADAAIRVSHMSHDGAALVSVADLRAALKSLEEQRCKG